MAKMISDLELIACHDILECLESLPSAHARRVLTFIWERVFAEDIIPPKAMPPRCNAAPLFPPEKEKASS